MRSLRDAHRTPRVRRRHRERCGHCGVESRSRLAAAPRAHAGKHSPPAAPQSREGSEEEAARPARRASRDCRREPRREAGRVRVRARVASVEARAVDLGVWSRSSRAGVRGARRVGRSSRGARTRSAIGNHRAAIEKCRGSRLARRAEDRLARRDRRRLSAVAAAVGLVVSAAIGRDGGGVLGVLVSGQPDRSPSLPVLRSSCST